MIKDCIRVGGFAPFSDCDFPGELSAVVFLQGCVWQCRFCHNGELRPTISDHLSPWTEIAAFLAKRAGLLDAVVFSGGEPLVQAGLPEAVTQMRDFGFRIGLHTGGCAPDRFQTVLPLVDWVGFDVKAPFAEYARITGIPDSGEKARASLKLLIASGKAYELRTTVHPKLLDAAAIARLNADLAELGAGPTKIQPFRALGCLDPELVEGYADNSPPNPTR